MQAFDRAVPSVSLEFLNEEHALVPLDRTDPRFCEPLIEVGPLGIAFESHHAREDGGNWPYHGPVPGSRKEIWLRKTVAEKLLDVNRHLEPFGVEVMVFDGYRSLACQRGMWEFFYAEAQQLYPDDAPEDWHATALTSSADANVFDADDPFTWPAHITGAAVDLTLRDRTTGKMFDLGGRFEEISTESATDYFEKQLTAGHIAHDNLGLVKRRLLYWAMTTEGFQNDPTVFWHYDWGSQLYVHTRRGVGLDAPPAAWYGYIEEPPRP